MRKIVHATAKMTAVVPKKHVNAVLKSAAVAQINEIFLRWKKFNNASIMKYIHQFEVCGFS